jgi:hypothetical protein
MTEILSPKYLWTKAIPLNQAWNVFASEQEKTKLLEIENRIQKFELDDAAPFLSALWNLGTMRQRSKDQETAKADLFESFRSGVLQDLEGEFLYGFGIPAPPSTARMPRKIESIFWNNPSLNWSEDTGFSERLGFIQIRIIDPNDYPNFEFENKKPGPKTSENVIISAIKLLNATDVEFWHGTHGNRINKLREFIRKSQTDLDLEKRGYSDKNFEKYLLKYKKENKIQ